MLIAVRRHARQPSRLQFLRELRLWLRNALLGFEADHSLYTSDNKVIVSGRRFGLKDFGVGAMLSVAYGFFGGGGVGGSHLSFTVATVYSAHI